MKTCGTEDRRKIDRRAIADLEIDSVSQIVGTACVAASITCGRVGDDPLARFAPDAVRDEKLKVLRALEPINSDNFRDRVVLGRYRVNDRSVDGERDLSPATATFTALKASIANWRWSGTPFYLMTGKRLQTRASEIAIVFKRVPHSIFSHDAGALQQNALSIRLQPDEGITLQTNIKDPGPGGMRIITAPLDMTFANSVGAGTFPDAYERLILDVVRGNQTLFMRSDEVEAAWNWIDPIVEAAATAEPPKPYDPGTMGPSQAAALIHQDRRQWRYESIL
jgi:glucose-6-phosphate 1-dehydrogenase